MTSRRRFITLAGTVAGTAATSPLALSSPPSKKWDREYDVIVVGFGVSGACAAYEACRAGARVLVLDRGSAAANESHGSIFYFGGGTRLQQALQVEDTQEEMLKYLIASNEPEPDLARIQVFVEQSISNFEWLLEIGMPFSFKKVDDPLRFTGNELAWICSSVARPAARGHVPLTAGNRLPLPPGGAWLQKRLLSMARDAGATLLLAADAQRIVRGGDGVIQGVLASSDGRLHAFRARRGVILASGGFSNNRRMLAEHAPHLLSYMPVDVGSNDGWGIRAGQSVGASVRRSSGADVTWAVPPSSVVVNSKGHRFAAEDSYRGVLGDLLVRTQGGQGYALCDATMRGTYFNGLFSTDIQTVEADSIAALEQALKIPEPILQQTVEVYNRHAKEGYDPLFRKAQEHLRPLIKPPFTATKATGPGGRPLPFFTLGGLHTTVHTEVLDAEHAVIPRLYAVGRTVAGIPSPTYYTSGLSLAEGVCFGRIGGRYAATQNG